MKIIYSISFILIVTSMASVNKKNSATESKSEALQGKKSDTATFGAGCFWCVEAIFQDLSGVESVVSGYSGGHLENPSYEQVTDGSSGHAEVCQIIFDPEKISYSDLLMVFWQTHDPTTLNKQGNDFGPQYRSVIFYHNDDQRELAELYKTQLDATHTWNKPVITEIKPYQKFYKAENYHQDYFNLNSKAPYCTFVIQPKIDKFREVFKDKLRK